jgi:hypothetical protein
LKSKKFFLQFFFQNFVAKNLKPKYYIIESQTFGALTVKKNDIYYIRRGHRHGATTFSQLDVLPTSRLTIFGAKQGGLKNPAILLALLYRCVYNFYRPAHIL